MKYTIDPHFVFSPAVAISMLECNYVKNRAIDKNHVDFLARQMKMGKFLNNNYVQVAELGGNTVLVDGQHRLSAIAKTGIAQTLCLQTYQCDTELDIQELYANCDVNKPRNFRVQMLGNDADGKTGIPMGDINRIKSAISFMHDSANKSGRAKRKYSSSEWIELVSEWAEAYRDYKELTKGSDIGMRMLSAPVLSCALITMKHQRDLAIDFWGAVARDDMLAYGDARKTLNKFISIHFLTVRGRGKNKTVGRPEMFSACSKAWNKYTDGVTVKQVSSLTSGKLVTPSKTPYDGTYESVS